MIPYIVLGILVGQLLVWLADRLPDRRSLLSTTICPVCGKSLDNLSPAGRWAVTLGRRGCQSEGERIRWRSLAIILVTAAGFGFLWSRHALPQNLIPLSVYWSIFVLITVIDLEHRLILHIVIFPAWAAAIIGAFFTTEPGIWRVLLGGLTGFLLMFFVYLLSKPFVKLMAKRRGQPIDEVPFGAGDVTLATFIGLVTGFPGVVFALVIGILVGFVGALAYLLWEAFVRKRYVAFTAIPYGPFLVIGALVMMIYGEQIVYWYVQPYM